MAFSPDLARSSPRPILPRSHSAPMLLIPRAINFHGHLVERAEVKQDNEQIARVSHPVFQPEPQPQLGNLQEERDVGQLHISISNAMGEIDSDDDEEEEEERRSRVVVAACSICFCFSVVIIIVKNGVINAMRSYF